MESPTKVRREAIGEGPSESLISARKARSLVGKKAEALGIPITKMKAETVSFADLARCTRVFVKIEPDRRLTREERRARSRPPGAPPRIGPPGASLPVCCRLPGGV